MFEEELKLLEYLRRIQKETAIASLRDFESWCRLKEAQGYIEVVCMRMHALIG